MQYSASKDISKIKFCSPPFHRCICSGRVTPRRPLWMCSCCLLFNVMVCKPPHLHCSRKKYSNIEAQSVECLWTWSIWSFKVGFKVTLNFCLIWKIPYLDVWVMPKVHNVWRCAQRFAQYLPTRWSANYTLLLDYSHAHSFMAVFIIRSPGLNAGDLMRI